MNVVVGGNSSIVVSSEGAGVRGRMPFVSRGRGNHTDFRSSIDKKFSVCLCIREESCPSCKSSGIS